MPANPLTPISFLPLSFFTSLFGINAREWSGEPENLTLRTMLTIAGKLHPRFCHLDLLNNKYHPFHRPYIRGRDRLRPSDSLQRTPP